MDGPVRYESGERLGTVTIDQPDARNMLTPPVVEGLHDALSALEDTRCLVLQGAGETFCAGGDLEGIVQEVTGDLSTEALLDRFERIDELIERIVAFPAPTVAVVDGPAYGTGGSLALACDVTIGSPAGSIGFGFQRLGLPPGAGASFFLPRRVGASTGLKLVITGESLNATTAARLGLFDWVVDGVDVDRVLAEVVVQITSADRTVLAETKRLFRSDRAQLVAAMRAERDARKRGLEQSAHRESVLAFLEGSVTVYDE